MKLFTVSLAFTLFASAHAFAAETSKTCAVCTELESAAAEFAALPGSVSANGPERVARETKEDDLLKKAGLRIAALFEKGRKPSPAETDAAAIFLAKTAERDRRGVAIDWIATTLGKKFAKASTALRARLAPLATAGKLTAAESAAAQDRFRIQAEESESGQN